MLVPFGLLFQRQPASHQLKDLGNSFLARTPRRKKPCIQHQRTPSTGIPKRQVMNFIQTHSFVIQIFPVLIRAIREPCFHFQFSVLAKFAQHPVAKIHIFDSAVDTGEGNVQSQILKGWSISVIRDGVRLREEIRIR